MSKVTFLCTLALLLATYVTVSNASKCKKEGQLLPYPGDGSRFYVCSEQLQPLARRCPLRQRWNQERQRCLSIRNDLGKSPPKTYRLRGTNSSQKAAADQYVFKNVRIDGGGFVPGIIFNPSEKDLIYARTDIGGAYRWDPSTDSWIPLLDWVDLTNWGYQGVISLATDPVFPDRVYVAAGMYTNDWDPNNGAILRSTDRGQTWQKSVDLPFKLGGNMPGRGMGEALVVDPNDNSIVYFGTPNKNGLWRTTNSGDTWSKVDSFPNPGNYAQDPSDTTGYLSHEPGVTWVLFDPRSSSSGKASNIIYVGVADLENIIYRSVDAGDTWERLAGQPTGYLAHRAALDVENGFLFIATSDTGGPYDGAKGDVWRFDTSSEIWTNVSPIPSSTDEDYFGYSGLSIDVQQPGTLMVATQVSWWPDIIIYRSTDSGATWSPIWEFTSYPNRDLRYVMDASEDPWLTFGTNPQPPEVAPKLGWMTECLQIDPHNSNRMLYGTGATIYGTDNLLDWDNGGQIKLTPRTKGLEETAVLDLISPPSGPQLISGLGDIGGFTHPNLETVQMMFTMPVFTSTTGLDFAEQNPMIVVRVGDADTNHIGFSTDGGSNWFASGEPGGVSEGGTVAAAADGSRFVWAPTNLPVVYSTGFGNNWVQSSGVQASSLVRSDRVNPNTFYAYKSGNFYVSTDGGVTFQESASGLPSEDVQFKVVPNVEGDIWLASPDGLFHSTDGGLTFAKSSGDIDAVNVGFGKAPADSDYVTLFLVGQVGSDVGVFRSDDAGETWVLINDEKHQYGNIGQALTGDPRIYGRVYIGTNGRGIIYGDIAN